MRTASARAVRRASSASRWAAAVCSATRARAGPGCWPRPRPRGGRRASRSPRPGRWPPAPSGWPGGWRRPAGARPRPGRPPAPAAPRPRGSPRGPAPRPAAARRPPCCWPAAPRPGPAARPPRAPPSACASLRIRSASAFAAATTSSTVRLAHAVCSPTSASSASASSRAATRCRSASSVPACTSAADSPRARSTSASSPARVSVACSMASPSTVSASRRASATMRLDLGLHLRPARRDLVLDLGAAAGRLLAGLVDDGLGVPVRLVAGLLGLRPAGLGVGGGDVAQVVGLLLGPRHQVVGGGRGRGDHQGGLVGGVAEQLAGLVGGLGPLPLGLGQGALEPAGGLLEGVRAAADGLLLEPARLGVPAGDLVVQLLGLGAHGGGRGALGGDLLLGLLPEAVGLGLGGVQQPAGPLGDRLVSGRRRVVLHGHASCQKWCIAVRPHCRGTRGRRRQTSRKRLMAGSWRARSSGSRTPRPSSGARQSTPTLPWCGVAVHVVRRLAGVLQGVRPGQRGVDLRPLAAAGWPPTPRGSWRSASR